MHACECGEKAAKVHTYMLLAAMGGGKAKEIAENLLAKKTKSNRCLIEGGEIRIGRWEMGMSCGSAFTLPSVPAVVSGAPRLALNRIQARRHTDTVHRHMIRCGVALLRTSAALLLL